MSLACGATSAVPATPPTLDDFAFLVGTWEGELTYLDYGDDTTRVTLATRVAFRRDGDVLRFTYRYLEPDGREVSDEGTVAVDADGRVTFGPETYALVASEDGGEVWTRRLVRRGTDNDRPVEVMRVVSREDDRLTLTKEIRPEDAPAFERNRYTLRRVGE